MSTNQLNTNESVKDQKNVSLIDGTGRVTDFACPRCLDKQLEVGNIFKFQVCFCSECLGFVIDSPTLGLMVNLLRSAYSGPEDKPKPIDQRQIHKTVACPTCLETMATHSYYGPGNVVLDSCQICKLTWLDNDELTVIMRAPGKR